MITQTQEDAPALVATDDTQNTHTVQDESGELLGINVQALLRFGEIAAQSTLMPPKVERGLRLLPQAVNFVPLIESLQSGKEPEANELQPYRQVVRETFRPVALIEKVASKLGSRVSEALDKKIDAKIVEKTEAAAQTANNTLQQHVEDVQHIARFENPQAQLTTEMSLLSKTVGAAIRNEQALRVSGGETKHESVPGLRGMVINAVHKIKGFFRRLFGKSEPQTEITAYDAGRGIYSVLRQFKENPDTMNAEKRFPLLNRFVQKVVSETNTLLPDHYALVAPEILDFLYSGARTEDVDQELLGSVTRNPHDLRFVTRFGNLARRLTKIRNASHTLIPAFRDILPTSNTQLLNILQKLDVFFHLSVSVSSNENVPDNTLDVVPVKGTKRDRAKELLKKLRRKNKVNR